MHKVKAGSWYISQMLKLAPVYILLSKVRLVDSIFREKWEIISFPLQLAAISDHIETVKMSWVQVAVNFCMFSAPWSFPYICFFMFVSPCQKSAPDAVASVGNRKVKKSFPHIYEITFQCVSDQLLLLSLSLLLLTNAVLLVALETDKYTDTILCIYFNIYSQGKHGSGNVKATTPPYAMHFSYAAMFSREVSPPPALLVSLPRLNAEGVGCFYAVHWSESLFSFLANKQIVIRVRLWHTWFLSLWAGCKPAKQWGALSPSQGFHNPLQAGTRNLS